MAEQQLYLTAIARQQFGPLVSKLVEVMLVSGPLTLASLVKFSLLTAPVVRKSLAVGLQHGFIICTFERKGPLTASLNQTNIDPKMIKVFYSIDQAHLGARLRFPSYCVRARDTINGAAELCVQALCLHGILTTHQIIDHAISQSHTQPIADISKADITNGLKALVGHRFIRKALVKSSSDITNHDGENELKLDAITEKPKAKGRASAAADSKKRKRIVEDDVPAEPEAAPKKRGRPSRAKVVAAVVEPEPEEEEDPGNSSMDDSPFADIVLNPEDHWILNDRRFVQENVRDGIVDFALDRFGSTGAMIIRSMIDQYPVEYVKPPTMSAERIHGIIASQPSIAQNFSLQTIQSTLLSMSQHDSHFLVGLDSGYELRIPTWQLYVRSLHISSVLHAKYGVLSSRLFRVLKNHGKLEETQLADLCTASRKQIREVLHRLMADEWCMCTEVPRTADRAPTKTFFLWSIDRKRVNDRMINALLMSARKLNERIAHESEQVSEIVSKLEMQRPIDETEKQAIDHWTRATARLEQAMKEVMKVKQIGFE